MITLEESLSMLAEHHCDVHIGRSGRFTQILIGGGGQSGERKSLAVCVDETIEGSQGLADAFEAALRMLNGELSRIKK